MSGIWMDWNRDMEGFKHGHCPIPDTLNFTVKYRDSDFLGGFGENQRHPAYWYDFGCASDIIAFRIKKQGAE